MSHRQATSPRPVAVFVFAGLLSAALLIGCKGNVKHPPSGEANTKEYCRDRRPSENNCMACSSQPGCGWCDSPRRGEAHCQPGVDAHLPDSCDGGWAHSTESCATPPPPPPPASLASDEETGTSPQSTKPAAQ